MAFAIGSALGGIAGALYAPLVQYHRAGLVHPVALAQTAADGDRRRLAAIFFGPFVGAVVAVLLPEWLRFTEGYYLVIYAVAVIVLMVWSARPGVLGLVDRVADAARVRPRRCIRGASAPRRETGHDARCSRSGHAQVLRRDHRRRRRQLRGSARARSSESSGRTAAASRRCSTASSASSRRAPAGRVRRRGRHRHARRCDSTACGVGRTFQCCRCFRNSRCATTSSSPAQEHHGTIAVAAVRPRPMPGSATPPIR